MRKSFLTHINLPYLEFDVIYCGSYPYMSRAESLKLIAALCTALTAYNAFMDQPTW
jgi:hypothetical protein